MSEIANTGIKSPSLASQLALARDRELDEIIARWDNGERADAAAILQTAPHLAASRSAVVVLAYEEFCQRQERGEKVVVDDYVAKFPRHETVVRKVIAYHPLGQDPRLPQRLAPGTEVRQYELVDWLGRGAFSQVYLACDHSLAQRPVVLKVTRLPGIEAEALATVDSPYVVPVYAATKDEAQEQTTIVMPFFGPATFEDLAERLKRTPRPRGQLIFDVAATSAALAPKLPPATMPTEFARRPFLEGAVWLLRGVAEGLSKAHESGYLHLDLKPSNILLAAGACPMLADFNLSRRCDEQLEEIGGTVPYMAPEQLRRFVGEKDVPVGEAADVYALGVIAHELLTGEHPLGPIDKENKEKTGQDLAGELLTKVQGVRRRPTAARKLSPSLRRLIDECLHVDPKRRPTSEEVRRRLTRELGTVARVTRIAARRPLIACLVACLMFAAVAGGVYAWNRPVDVVVTARTAIQQGKYDDAVQLLEPRIGGSADVELNGLYAYACMEADKRPKAIPVFRSLRRAGDQTTANLNNYARALILAGAHKEAGEILDEMAGRGIDDRAFLFNFGIVELLRAQVNTGYDPIRGLNALIQADRPDDRRGELSFTIARLRVYVSKFHPQSDDDILADLRQARENGLSQETAVKDHLFSTYWSRPGFGKIPGIEGAVERFPMDKLILPPRAE